MMRRKSRGTRPQRNAEKRAARRVILPGFPVEPRSFTLAEVRDYFSGDWITCLLCGKSYRKLSAAHLHRIHSMTEDEYRARYGLPWRRGLISTHCFENYSAATRKRMDEGWSPPNDPDGRALGHAAARGQRSQPFRRELAIKNVASANPNPIAYVGENVLATMIERIKSGRTPKEVRDDDDMPSQTWLTVNLTESDKASIRDVIWSMPFDFQARAQFGMAPNFFEAIKELRPMSDKKIAQRLGVTAMTVNRWRRLQGIP